MTRTDKKYKNIDLQMDRFGDIPTDIDEFIENRILQPYLFINPREKYGYCTKCKHEMKIQKVRHLTKMKCPLCGADIVVKNLNIWKYRYDVKWFVIVESNDRDVLTRYFKVVISWYDHKKPIWEIKEELRSIIGKECTKSYMYWYRQGYPEMRWVEWRNRGMNMNAYTSQEYYPHEAVCYSNIDEVIKDTWCKYSCLGGLIKDVDNSSDGTVQDCAIEEWLGTYRNKPIIEQLYKVGFFNLLKWSVSYNGRDYIKTGTNIYEILGVKKREYKLLKELGNPTEHEYLSILNGCNTNVQDVQICANQARKNYAYFDRMKMINDYVPIVKAVRYMSRYNINIHDYSDYISWLNELDYDMKDKYYLYPKDFVSMHDRIMKEENELKEEKKEKERRLHNEILKKLAKDNEDVQTFKMHYGGLFIMVADSVESLQQEGRILHHCVATYADRMARGETMIMFIRKEQEPMNPYFTMEFKEGHVVQLRGAHNCEPSADVVDFRKEFERRLLKEFKIG